MAALLGIDIFSDRSFLGSLQNRSLATVTNFIVGLILIVPDFLSCFLLSLYVSVLLISRWGKTKVGSSRGSQKSEEIDCSPHSPFPTKRISFYWGSSLLVLNSVSLGKRRFKQNETALYSFLYS